MESATYNNAISIRIELIVSSMKKAQLKSLAYKLFDEFGIDDDCDLLSIEYNSTQQKNRTNLYDQCLVHFRQEPGRYCLVVYRNSKLDNFSGCLVGRLKQTGSH
jgi:hypothetical protein